MPKKSASYELTLTHRNRGVPAYQWLYEAIRSEILSGRLRPGTRLPATRDVARQYGLARGTIVNAFDQLGSEGYVESNVGSGTFVSKVLPERMLHVASESDEKPRVQRKHPLRISDYARRAKMFPGYENRPIRAFRANLPALDLFPTDLWNRITLRCLRKMSTRNLMGCDPLGNVALRQARGFEVRFHRRSVLTRGAQQAALYTVSACPGPMIYESETACVCFQHSREWPRRRTRGQQKRYLALIPRDSGTHGVITPLGKTCNRYPYPKYTRSPFAWSHRGCEAPRRSN